MNKEEIKVFRKKIQDLDLTMNDNISEIVGFLNGAKYDISKRFDNMEEEYKDRNACVEKTRLYHDKEKVKEIREDVRRSIHRLLEILQYLEMDYDKDPNGIDSGRFL